MTFINAWHKSEFESLQCFNMYFNVMAGVVLELINNFKDRRGCNTVCLKKKLHFPQSWNGIELVVPVAPRWNRGGRSYKLPACCRQYEGPPAEGLLEWTSGSVKEIGWHPSLRVSFSEGWSKAEYSTE